MSVELVAKSGSASFVYMTNNNFDPSDDNYIEELDNKLTGGKEPSHYLPIKKRDIIQVIVRLHFSLDAKEYAILHTYCASGFQIEYTIKFHNISRSQLYQIIDKAHHIYTDPLVQNRGHLKNS